MKQHFARNVAPGPPTTAARRQRATNRMEGGDGADRLVATGRAQVADFAIDVGTATALTAADFVL
ncbi:hypothetical protein QFZ27_003530 [Inquilinus ginsengisoli]